MKKKPKLLVVFSVFVILSGILSLVAFIMRLYPNIKGAYAPWYSPIIAFLYIVAGIGVFKLKNWARWLVLIFCFFFIIKTPFNIVMWLNRFGDSAAESKMAVLFAGALTFAVYALVAYYIGVRVRHLFKKQ